MRRTLWKWLMISYKILRFTSFSLTFKHKINIINNLTARSVIDTKENLMYASKSSFRKISMSC